MRPLHAPLRTTVTTPVAKARIAEALGLALRSVLKQPRAREAWSGACGDPCRARAAAVAGGGAARDPLTSAVRTPVHRAGPEPTPLVKCGFRVAVGPPVTMNLRLTGLFGDRSR